MSSLQWRDFDPAAFLRDYWQRKPLLIRRAFNHWQNPLAPDELAGLACEEGAETRLIVQDVAKDEWILEQGPLAEERFATLPTSHWTLLVQAVDHWVPEVAALLEPFRFLPDWRIDDVMVSYAADQGGVGPHVDQYDVFLVQGLGRRRWQVGPLYPVDTPLREGLPLRQLANFEVVEEWLLEPGDILYLPPGYGHHGVAEGDDCMTYSVGFRAPSRSELVAHWAGHVLAELSEDDRYRDPPLQPAASPSLIDPAAMARARQMMLSTLSDPVQFQRWFGLHVTAPKYPELLDDPDPITADVLRELARHTALERVPGSRFARCGDADNTQLFADGECHPCPAALAPLAQWLADGQRFTPAELAPWLTQPEAVALLCKLHDQAALRFTDD